MAAKQDKAPELAIGIRRTPAGWSVVEYQLKDGRVVKEKVTEPDLRALALEQLRKSIAVFWDEIN